jgi:2-methylcitrate dehydratase PrpD
LKGEIEVGNQTYSEKLTEFGIQLKYGDIPALAITNAKYHILDVIGVILASSYSDTANTIKNTLHKMGGRQESTVIGSDNKFPAPLAAMANATMAHTPDFDDTHGESIIHPSSVVVPTSLAVGETQGTNGKDFIAAAVAAYEIILRIGMVAPGKFHAIGFHPTPICGIFGAALISGKLKGLDPLTIRNAMGICGSQAAGLLEFLSDGSSVKRFHPGWACYSGIFATLLAEEGMTGPATVLEGRFGFYRTHLNKEEYNLERLTEGLGTKWEVNNISYKLYPCCHHIPAFADCVREIKRKETIQPDEIEEIECIISPGQADLVCRPVEDKVAPRTPYDAKFSLPYVIAVMISRGKCGLNDFTDEAIREEKVLQLAKKVKHTLSDSTGYPGSFPGWVKIKLKNGKVLEHREKVNRGGPDNPVGEEEIIDKFENNAQLLLSSQKVKEIKEQILNIEGLKDIRSVTSNFVF